MIDPLFIGLVAVMVGLGVLMARRDSRKRHDGSVPNITLGPDQPQGDWWDPWDLDHPWADDTFYGPKVSRLRREVRAGKVEAWAYDHELSQILALERPRQDTGVPTYHRPVVLPFGRSGRKVRYNKPRERHAASPEGRKRAKEAVSDGERRRRAERAMATLDFVQQASIERQVQIEEYKAQVERLSHKYDGAEVEEVVDATESHVQYLRVDQSDSPFSIPAMDGME